MITEFDSPKELIISHFVSLVAVPASARTGAEGNKLISKETNFLAWLVKKLGTK